MNESMIRLCFWGIFTGGKAAFGTEVEKDWGRSDKTAKLCAASEPHSRFLSKWTYYYIFHLFYFIYPPDPVWEKSRVGQTAIWMDVANDLSVQQTHARSYSWAWKSSWGNPTSIGWHGHFIISINHHIYWFYLFFYLNIYIYIYIYIYFYYFFLLYLFYFILLSLFFCL